MKILKRPNTNWTMKHTCRYCDAELEVEKSDIKHTHWDGDYREPPTDTYHAQCAVCGKAFDIPEEKLPKAVKLEVQQTR